MKIFDNLHDELVEEFRDVHSFVLKREKEEKQSN